MLPTQCNGIVKRVTVKITEEDGLRVIIGSEKKASGGKKAD